MNRILFILALCFLSGSVFSQNTSGSIYTMVYGDRVVINEDNAIRNCAFSPKLDNIILNNDVINWYQVDTTNKVYRCTCTFNYQVEIDYLNSGDYTVNVYSVYLSDTTFEGTTSFTIGSSVKSSSVVQYKTFASGCLTYVDDDDNADNNLTYKLYDDHLFFFHQYLNIRKVSILNMSGMPIQQLSGNSNEIALPVAFLKNGIYLAVIDTDEGQIVRKFTILR